MASVRENRNFVGNSRKHPLENIRSPGGELSIHFAWLGGLWCRHSAEPPPPCDVPSGAFGTIHCPHVTHFFPVHVQIPHKPPPATSMVLSGPPAALYPCPTFGSPSGAFPSCPLAELEAVHPSQAAADFLLLAGLGFGVKFPNFSQNPPPRARNGENWPP